MKKKSDLHEEKFHRLCIIESSDTNFNKSCAVIKILYILNIITYFINKWKAHGPFVVKCLPGPLDLVNDAILLETWGPSLKCIIKRLWHFPVRAYHTLYYEKLRKFIWVLWFQSFIVEVIHEQVMYGFDEKNWYQSAGFQQLWASYLDEGINPHEPDTRNINKSLLITFQQCIR